MPHNRRMKLARAVGAVRGARGRNDDSRERVVAGEWARAAYAQGR